MNFSLQEKLKPYFCPYRITMSTAVGTESLYYAGNNTDINTAVGMNNINMTGYPIGTTALNGNVAFGYSALALNTTGSNQCAFGCQTLPLSNPNALTLGNGVKSVMILAGDHGNAGCSDGDIIISNLAQRPHGGRIIINGTDFDELCARVDILEEQLSRIGQAFSTLWELHQMASKDAARRAGEPIPPTIMSPIADIIEAP